MEQEHLKAFDRLRSELVRLARRVAERGYSYRGFKVGCAVLAWRPKGISLTEKYKIFRAANAKPLQGVRKLCAEMTTVNYARGSGYEKIIAIVVAGLPQADGGSGVESKTLHPCEECRPFLAALPEVSQDTIIVCAHNHTGILEQFTLEELLELHKKHE